MLKSNSRFSILMEEPCAKKEDNKSRDNEKSNDREKNRPKEENKPKEVETLRKEKPIKDLSLDNFPELMAQEIDTNKQQANSVSFLDKLNVEIIKEEDNNVDVDFKNLKPGWQSIKRDLKTGETIIKSKSIVQSNYKEKTDLEVTYILLNRLSYLHEKRTNDYIDKWGKDEWENVFRFPNYDYEYFDKLDELTEAELEDNISDYYSDEYNEEYDIGKYNNFE